MPSSSSASLFHTSTFCQTSTAWDTKAHNNNTAQAIRLVREWLSTVSRRKTIPSLLALRNAFLEFEHKLPVIAADIGYAVDEIPFNDFCRIVEKAIAQKVQ